MVMASESVAWRQMAHGCGDAGAGTDGCGILGVCCGAASVGSSKQKSQSPLVVGHGLVTAQNAQVYSLYAPGSVGSTYVLDCKQGIQLVIRYTRTVISLKASWKRRGTHLGNALEAC